MVIKPLSVLMFLTLCAAADSVTYMYDSLNRLVMATYASGLVIKYTYDPNGNVRAKSSTTMPIYQVL